jgi:acyl carrier protein phosphodiesterase
MHQYKADVSNSKTLIRRSNINRKQPKCQLTPIVLAHCLFETFTERFNMANIRKSLILKDFISKANKVWTANISTTPFRSAALQNYWKQETLKVYGVLAAISSLTGVTIYYFVTDRNKGLKLNLSTLR